MARKIARTPVTESFDSAEFERATQHAIHLFRTGMRSPEYLIQAQLVFPNHPTARLHRKEASLALLAMTSEVLCFADPPTGHRWAGYPLAMLEGYRAHSEVEATFRFSTAQPSHVAMPAVRFPVMADLLAARSTSALREFLLGLERGWEAVTDQSFANRFDDQPGPMAARLELDDGPLHGSMTPDPEVTATSIPPRQQSTDTYERDCMSHFEQGHHRSERRDLHNINVNEAAARADLCGTIHLQDGGLCLLPALHAGPCQFKPPAGPAA
jgi:hypothetical protein